MALIPPEIAAQLSWDDFFKVQKQTLWCLVYDICKTFELNGELPYRDKMPEIEIMVTGGYDTIRFSRFVVPEGKTEIMADDEFLEKSSFGEIIKEICTALGDAYQARRYVAICDGGNGKAEHPIQFSDVYGPARYILNPGTPPKPGTKNKKSNDPLGLFDDDQ
jgi:hypothetical protein